MTCNNTSDSAYSLRLQLERALLAGHAKQERRQLVRAVLTWARAEGLGQLLFAAALQAVAGRTDWPHEAVRGLVEELARALDLAHSDVDREAILATVLDEEAGWCEARRIAMLDGLVDALEPQERRRLRSALRLRICKPMLAPTIEAALLARL